MSNSHTSLFQFKQKQTWEHWLHTIKLHPIKPILSIKFDQMVGGLAMAGQGEQFLELLAVVAAC